MKTDSQIQNDVMGQLQYEPGLNACEIGVAVKAGIVVLSGCVDSFAKKIAAERASKRVNGVRAIVGDIRIVHSPAQEITGLEIASSVLNALKWHSSVPDDEIKVCVNNGMVTLEGEVEWEYQQHSAAAAIKGLPGVRTVENTMTIKPRVTAADVVRIIKDKLVQSAHVDADCITAEVTGNKVTLNGHVRSIVEKDDAQDAAWKVPGIIIVDNKIQVE